MRATAPVRHLRLRRRAFAVALACQGLMSAAGDGRRGPVSRRVVRRIASDFSRTIRRYSAGEQVPQAIIIVRRAIVSQDARVSSIIFGARKTGSKSFGCLVLRRFTSALTHVPLDRRSSRDKQRRSIALPLFQPETKAVYDPPTFRDGHVCTRATLAVGRDDRRGIVSGYSPPCSAVRNVQPAPSPVGS